MARYIKKAEREAMEKAKKKAEKEQAKSSNLDVVNTFLGETPPKPKPEPEVIKIYNFRFITTCSNLNIANVVFNKKKVVIFEIDTDTYERAADAFKKQYLAQFNNNEEQYNQFIHYVFGDQMIVEIVPSESIRREIVEIP